MAVFRLSNRAERDLLDIANHTLGTWGEEQTLRYIDELEQCCQRLADNPNLGRACDHNSPQVAAKTNPKLHYSNFRSI
ncbi:MAG: type II toxin-antitoxin system RelE/ParE family toxin [Deltaproteobacteria bacterium]|nr:type II toxin-antitoxin system RelE/ParE family toxin [Deltaproteobacteria bacterium]